MTTPRMSQHARERCLQMRIRTKRAKQVVRHRHMSYPSGRHDNSGLVCMSDDTDIAVVWDPGTNTIITVLPRTSEDYRR